MKTERHHFENSDGHQLAARLDLPALVAPRAYALFAHCFTCGKDLRAITNIAEALTAQGIAVFRFDFPGLGASGGDFADTTFTGNVDDLYRAAEYLAEIAEAPQILVGHSLGGAAVIRVAPLLDSVRAVVTIGAPADPVHVTKLLNDQLDTLERDGVAEVTIARREFRLKKAFLDDLQSVTMEEATARLGKALLVLHSPVDEVVGIDNAAAIYSRAKHPKSFITLDHADHLISAPADSHYAGNVIATWSTRYLDPVPQLSEDIVTARIGKRGLRTDLLLNGHPMVADEPIALGGTGLGPLPYDYLNGALGACTAMTLRLYADRKKWPLDEVLVELHHEKDQAEDGSRIDRIRRELTLVGDLDEAQRARLLEIADKCPVHRTLEGVVVVTTTLS